MTYIRQGAVGGELTSAKLCRCPRRHINRNLTFKFGAVLPTPNTFQSHLQSTPYRLLEPPPLPPWRTARRGTDTPVRLTSSEQIVKLVQVLHHLHQAMERLRLRMGSQLQHMERLHQATEPLLPLMGHQRRHTGSLHLKIPMLSISNLAR